MNSFFAKYKDNKKGINFLVVVVFTVFSNFSSFAQISVVSATFDVTTDVVNVTTNEVPVGVAASSTLNSNSNFILWFMGTRENPNKVNPSEGMCTKKGLISSGAEPNHLLIRTLLKKTVNSKFC